MTKTRVKNTQILTPFGRAGFCSLTRPNFKFQKQAGEFSARIVFSPEDAAPLVAQLDQLYEEAYARNLAEVRQDKPATRDIKRADKPYKNVEDPDTGEKLADIQVNARLKFRVIGKDETGREVVFRTQKPIVVDSKNKPMLTEIGNGSVIRMSVLVTPFFTPTLGSGLSLRLVGVQVKELVQIGMADPGFDDVEGFETVTASDPVETMHAPETAMDTTAPGAVTGAVEDDGGDY